MAGSGNGLNLYARPRPIVIEDREKYKVDCILCMHRQGSQQRFLVGCSGWDDSKAQWISGSKLYNAHAILVEWESCQ